jgi:tetratricopeptide (TPR) repeat protein
MQQGVSNERQRRAGLLVGLLLALVVAAAYVNSLAIDFQLDDHHVVERNPHVRSLANIPRFFVDPNLFSVNHQSKLFRPVLSTTYAINYAISGLDTWSYHLVNILLHWCVGVLIFRIVRDHLWLGPHALPVAVAAAVVVVAHPLNSEPVDYISSRSATLATVFYLGAFDMALRARARTCCALFALGLLTKPIVLTLPLTLLAHAAVGRSAGRPTTAVSWKLIAALVSLAIAFGLYHHWVSPTHIRAAMGEPGVTRWMYFMTGWSAYLYYLRLFLWPDALVIDRKDYPVVDSFVDPQAWGSLVVLLILLRLAWMARREYPALTFAALWYVLTLAPESTFFPLAEPVNEHRPYLAMLGIGTITGIGLWHLARHAAARHAMPAVWLFAVGLTFTTTALASTTIVRNRTWQDSYALWLDATRKAPHNPRAWLNVGHAEMGRGDYEAARRHLTRARVLAPCYHYVLINLSVLEARLGNLDRSLAWADDATRCGPAFPMTHYYRGLALERLARHDDALLAQREATAIDPYYVDAWYAQGAILEGHGAWEAAAAAYERAWSLDPTLTAAAMNLGVLYHHRLDRPEAAIALYDAVLGMVPDHYGALFQVALAHGAAGNEHDAARAWERFVPLARAIDDTTSIARGTTALRRRTRDPSAEVSRSASTPG